MAMTRKHYREVADILKSELDMEIDNFTDGVRHGSVERIAHRLSSMFADDNPHYSRTKFMEACGL